MKSRMRMSKPSRHHYFAAHLKASPVWGVKDKEGNIAVIPTPESECSLTVGLDVSQLRKIEINGVVFTRFPLHD